MYKEFYGMQIEAFVNQPSPDTFFSSKSHKEAWNYLAYGINSREPFMLVCGDYGIGKTTLCLKLVQSLKDVNRLPFVFFSTPIYAFSGFLAKVAEGLGVSVEHQNESAVQDLIVKNLESRADRSGILIIFDDAHEADVSILSRARMLASFNIDGYFPIRLLFFAHLSFIDRLRTDALLALNQRIKRRFYLRALDYSETKEYIYFRMVGAGAPGVPVFGDSAIQKIFEYSRGVPREINNICDACLLVGSGSRLYVIDDSVVSSAIDLAEGVHVVPHSRSAPAHAPNELPAPSIDSHSSADGASPFSVVLDDPRRGKTGASRTERPAAFGGSAHQAAASFEPSPETDETPNRVTLDFPLESEREVYVGPKVAPRKRLKLGVLTVVAVIVFLLGIMLATFVDFKPVVSMIERLVRG